MLKIKWIPNIVVTFVLFSHWIFAEGEPNVKASKPSAIEQFFPFIILGLVFYFLLIRPQQKKYKRQVDFLSQIKRGDEVLTTGGIFGRIEGLTDQFVVLEVAEDIRIRVLKSQVASYMNNKKDQPSTREK